MAQLAVMCSNCWQRRPGKIDSGERALGRHTAGDGRGGREGGREGDIKKRMVEIIEDIWRGEGRKEGIKETTNSKSHTEEGI